jgi:hypothetical protein
MAIGDDFTVNTAGDIRHASGSTNYTVLELHRWLQDLADDAQASGNDLIDITSSTPSERATDSIITLNSPYNIDDDAAENLYGGSITQDGGNTVYSGLQVLGSVNLTTTQLMVIQDGDIYQFTPTPASPFWGDQTAPYNGGGSTLMRILVKSRENGADYDGKKIRVQAREWFDSFDFFNVTLGQGESVAAIGTTDDPQNDTAKATVDAWTHVLNSGGTANAPTGGFQLIDLNNGNGNKEYISKWTLGADGPGAGRKGMYEYMKAIAVNATTKTTEGINGELYLGLTHEITYDGGSGTFQEREELRWGTNITYDTLANGPFTPGNIVTIGSNGASGRVMDDDGTDTLIVALDDTSITLLDGDTITEFPGPGAGATTTTADINVTIVDNDKQGGAGLIVGHDDNTGTGEFYIQLTAGDPPVDNLPLIGGTSNATAVTNTAPTAYTVPKVFPGVFTGSFIGAEGVGIDGDDLVSTDTIKPLDDSAQSPPNNVTITVNGLVTGDRVLVANRTGSAIDFAFDTHSALLTDGTSATMAMTTAIPLDTPTAAGSTVRIEDDNGVYVSIPYQSWTGSTFTFTGQGTGFYEGSDNANSAALNNVFISYIDYVDAGAGTISFTSAYQSDRDLFLRVRNGGASPIKTIENTTLVLGSTSQTITITRQADT